MPKQTFKIEGFHGGISSDTDPRDISNIESPELLDVKISSIGRIRTLGSTNPSTTTFTQSRNANSGLFVMGSDRKLNGAESDQTLIFNYDSASNTIDANDSDGWDAEVISFNDQVTPIYYSVDGILRIGDSTFEENNRWFGYISDVRFDGLTADSGSIGWYQTDQNILKPTKGKCLISTPSKVLESANGVNGENQEYDNVANAANQAHQVVDDDSVNLRVGLQIKGNISGLDKKEDWNLFNCTSFEQVEATAKPYNFFGKNIVFIGNENSISSSIDNLGRHMGSYSLIGENNSVVHPFFISEGRNFNDFDEISIKWGLQTSEDDTLEEPIWYEWTFDKEDIKSNCWNLLILKPSNFVNVYDPDLKLNFGEYWNYCKISVLRITGEEKISSKSLNFKISSPLRIENPGIDAFPPGDYSFHYTWLYDDIKQESLPFKFKDVDSEKLYGVHTGGDNATVYTQSASSFVADDLIGRTLNISDQYSNTTNEEGVITDNTASTITVNNLTGISTTLVNFSNGDYVVIKPSTANRVNVIGGNILFNFDIYNVVNPSDTYGINKRITGSRIYWKIKDEDNYFLIGEQDYVESGFKFLPFSDTFSHQMQNPKDQSDNYIRYSALVQGIKPESANILDTFRSLNGFSASVKSINAQYKTAVVHGRRLFIGNIKQNNKKFPDRIIKSQSNKFDSFPEGQNSIDVAIRDGESIIKLEAFADRLLQFKKNSLFIINVAANVEFLEDVYRNKGCSFDYHVTRTDYGICWFNIHGVYFFDGKQVSNLLEKNGTRLINESDWEIFITDSDDSDGVADDPTMSDCHIGFVPKRRQVLIKNKDNDIFIYDFVLRSWTKGKNKLDSQSGTGTNRTNMALNGDQDLFYINGASSQIISHVWNDDSASTSHFIYTTKDIDFGQPAVRKKIYKIYVTYKTGSATNILVKYDTNGHTDFDLLFANGTNFATNELVYDSNNQNKWITAELKPNTSSQANNIYSFALQFTDDGSVPSTFEINDITIVYRLKNVK